MNIQPIGHIKCDFSEKFGIPRQSGLVETSARIIFEPKFRSPDAFRGLEGDSHIWLLWEFDRAETRKEPSLTVRPPRLGGNKRMGVFATRSPFRPNPIGLSLVKLEHIIQDKKYGTVLEISGADLCDGTPIFDIKPYLPHIESKPSARGGFAKEAADYRLSVEVPEKIEKRLPFDSLEIIKKILSEDPRPSYQSDPERVYGMSYGKWEIFFKVEKSVLKVVDICEKLG